MKFQPNCQHFPDKNYQLLA